MFKEIKSEDIYNFLRENKARYEQICMRGLIDGIGYYENNDLKGVISVAYNKNTARVKTFFVKKECRKKGVGSKLLNKVLNDNIRFTTFATINSYNIFKKQGFKEIRTNKNNIRFMERRKKDE